MMAFIIAIHVLVCILLIAIILVQQGKGGGLVESLSSMESVFGTQTNTVLTQATKYLSITFFLTCLILALLSTRSSRSLMKNALPAQMPKAVQQAPQTVPPTSPVSSDAQGAIPQAK
jgi:preprotein translocase subunit SecG